MVRPEKRGKIEGIRGMHGIICSIKNRTKNIMNLTIDNQQLKS